VMHVAFFRTCTRATPWTTVQNQQWRTTNNIIRTDRHNST
jgi:hypothetical protein